MFVDTVKLRELDLPLVNVPLEKLLWHFDMPVWETDGTDDWNLTPWEVIKKEAGTTVHQKRVEAADANYPIVVTEYKGRFVVLDGVHRLVKVYMQGKSKILAKIIPTEYLLLPQFQS
jgi:hypothetical protein